MTVADPAGDAPAAGDRDGLPRRGFSASCGTRAGTFGGPGSFAKSLPTTSHSGSSAPSPGNDLLKLRWKPEVRVSIAFKTQSQTLSLKVTMGQVRRRHPAAPAARAQGRPLVTQPDAAPPSPVRYAARAPSASPIHQRSRR